MRNELGHASERKEPGVSRPARRGAGAGLAMGFAVFAVAGSLFPLQFQIVTSDRAIEQFSDEWRDPGRLESRADFAANILLFVPIGFFVMSALGAERWSAARYVTGSVALLLTAALFSVALEFAQLFVVSRLASAYDTIAHVAGTTTGTVLWRGYGSRLTEWLGGPRRGRAKARRVTGRDAPEGF